MSAPPNSTNSPLKMFILTSLGAFGALVMLIIISGVFGDLGASVVNLGKSIGAIADKPSQNKRHFGVTTQDFLAVRTGMGVGDIFDILGTGTELSRSDLAGYNTVMYGWKNRDGSNMNVMFQNGRVVSKAQFGLR